MPELPEVETIVRHLRAALPGRRLETVRLLWEGIVDRPSSALFTAHLRGRGVDEVARRGKYVLIRLEDGWTWAVHLRMTGRFLWGPPRPPWARHLRFVAHLDDGRQLNFISVRKFARFYLVDDEADVVGWLGMEPLGAAFIPQALHRQLRGRRATIKSLLLSQRVVAGLGNIYTCEALWRARIDPRRRAATLTPEETAHLQQAIVAVLTEALARGGSTLRDGQYTAPDGNTGTAQHHLAIYGRAGEPCPQCGQPIVRLTQSGRSTYLCPRCQR